MKLSKKQKEVIFANIEISSKIIGNVEYLFWNAGKGSYNIGMKQTWNKDQKEYLDGMENRLNSKIDSVEDRLNKRIDLVEDRLNKRIDSVQNEMNNNFDILFKHLGIKK